MTPILLSPAIVFSALYGITLITFLYELYIRYTQLTGYIHYTILLYLCVKTIAYGIRSYEGTLSVEELSHDTTLLLTSQLFLLFGTVIIVRALYHHLVIVYK